MTLPDPLPLQPQSGDPSALDDLARSGTPPPTTPGWPPSPRQHLADDAGRVAVDGQVAEPAQGGGGTEALRVVDAHPELVDRDGDVRGNRAGQRRGAGGPPVEPAGVPDAGAPPAVAVPSAYLAT